MREIQITKQFKKDVKRLKKQGKDFEKMKAVIDAIYNVQKLDKQFYDHKLSGNYANARECHLESDWLLIYEISEEALKLCRTGSHSELFKM